jgi:hypothetical protein
MTSRYWIKLYIEILDDPKMGKMPDWLFRRALELFLLAGETGDDGLLPSAADIAWRLRIMKPKLTRALSALSLAGVVHETPKGWVVTHFSDRQSPSPVTDRVREFRKRNAKGTKRFRNETVAVTKTAPESESESDAK